MSNKFWRARIMGAGLFGREAVRRRWKLTLGQPLLVEREPNNVVDANAIKLSDLCGQPVGYVARAVAAQIAPVIDNGVMVMARVHSIPPGSSLVPVALLWTEEREKDRPAKVVEYKGQETEVLYSGDTVVITRTRTID